MTPASEREREREKEKEREREREGGRDRERKREGEGGAAFRPRFSDQASSVRARADQRPVATALTSDTTVNE